MNKNVVAAIMAAVNSYMEQEAPARPLPVRALPPPEISSWRIFGRQELVRGRIHWQATRRHR